MAATFNGNPKATIISYYSPTNVSEETELVTFYEELSALVRRIPKHNLLAIGGDMNGFVYVCVCVCVCVCVETYSKEYETNRNQVLNRFEKW